MSEERTQELARKLNAIHAFDKRFPELADAAALIERQAEEIARLRDKPRGEWDDKAREACDQFEEAHGVRVVSAEHHSYWVGCAEAAEAEARQERERAQLAWSENEQASAAMHFAKQEAEDAKAEARQLREQLERLSKVELEAIGDIADLMSERQALREQLAACERDAARYRWIRKGDYTDEWFSTLWTNEGMDVSIDAAMSAKEDK